MKLKSKPPSHIEKVLSSLQLFQKKIEIDDEQKRLGPSNKVNLPQHSSLYFNTNHQNLLLKILDKNPAKKAVQKGANSDVSSSSYS